MNNILFNDDNVVYRVLSSRLGLNEGRWKIVGKLVFWDRDYWKVPTFYQKDSIEDFYWKVEFDDELEEASRTIVDKSEVPDKFPTPGLGGYGFVEKVLSKKLSIDC